MKQLIISIFLLLSINLAAQNSIFEWDEGLTYYKGKIDTTKYNLQEIKDIYSILHSPSIASNLYIVGNVWSIEQMDTITTQAVDSYLITTLHKIETLKTPKSEFWDSLKFYRKKELEEHMALKRTYLFGLKKPEILYKNANTNCLPIIKTLNGSEEELLKGWYELKETQKKSNGSPGSVEEKYQMELLSSNRLKYARLELMTYAWYNCVNSTTFHYEDQIRIEKEFEKLFIKVEIEESED